MRNFKTLGLFTIMIFLAPGRFSIAQEASPAGSYQQTCSDISVKKDTLYAKCQDDKGKAHHSKLSKYEKCPDIVNKGGHLACAHGEKAAATQPPGPYTESCKEIKMKGSTLHAICKSLDGREMPITLKDADRCIQGVANVNGILRCQASDVLPPGSYIATCKDVRLQGTALLASCKDGKDRWHNAELRDANKCAGDIANHDGILRCTAINMEKR
jgi:hypothetical protein